MSGREEVVGGGEADDLPREDQPQRRSWRLRLRGHATVRVVESSEDRRGRELRGPRDVRRLIGDRRFAAEPLMRALGVVVVLDELAKKPLKMASAERDDVIEKLAPQRPDEPLDVRILPGTVEGRPHLLNAAALEERRHSIAVDAVVVPVPGALAPDVGPALTRRA